MLAEPEEDQANSKALKLAEAQCLALKDKIKAHKPVLSKAIAEIKRVAATKDKQMKEAALKTLAGKHAKQVGAVESGLLNRGCRIGAVESGLLNRGCRIGAVELVSGGATVMLTLKLPSFSCSLAGRGRRP